MSDFSRKLVTIYLKYCNMIGYRTHYLIVINSVCGCEQVVQYGGPPLLFRVSEKGIQTLLFRNDLKVY